MSATVNVELSIPYELAKNESQRFQFRGRGSNTKGKSSIFLHFAF